MTGEISPAKRQETSAPAEDGARTRSDVRQVRAGHRPQEAVRRDLSTVAKLALLKMQGSRHDRGMLNDEDPKLAPIATRKMLLASGYDDKALRRAVRSGDLVRVRHGVYASGQLWKDLDDLQQYAVRCRAAVMLAKTDTFLSHTSALPFLDAPIWNIPRDDVHLSRTDGKTGRREAGVRQHRGAVLRGDVVIDHGLAVSSATRAALEIVTVAGVEAALVVVTDLVHRGLTSVEKMIERQEASMEHWPYSLHMDLVTRLADARIESVGEARTWYLFWHEGLPRPVPQYEVRDASGELLGRLDFAWPEHGVWLEFDGRVKYEKYRKPGENAVDVVLREKRREERITEVTGWRCIRITWADLADPKKLATRIRVLLAMGRSAAAKDGARGA